MKIGKLEIIHGPNIPWYLVTILFVVFGGWKGLLIWLAINVLALVINKPLREHFFKKTKK